MNNDIRDLYNNIKSALKEKLKTFLNQKEIDNLFIAITSNAAHSKTKEEFVIRMKSALPEALLMFNKENNKFSKKLESNIPELKQKNDYYKFLILVVYLINISTIDQLITYDNQEKKDLFIKIVSKEEQLENNPMSINLADELLEQINNDLNNTR
jgi:hypothetical protein